MLQFASAMMDELITVDQAAGEFGVHRATLFRAIREGTLGRHRRIGDKRTYVGRWEVQRMVDLPTVTRCLALVFDEFHQTTEWPRVDVLQRRLARAQDDFNLTAAIDTLPRDLGWRVRDQEGRAELTMRGIARCESSGPEVSAYVSVVRASYDLYMSDADELVLTSDNLAAQFGYDAPMLVKLYRMLQIESGWWQMLGKNGDQWNLTVSDRIRFFRHVESISDYFVAVQEMFGQPVARPPARLVPAQATVAGSVDSYVYHPQIETAAAELLRSGNGTAAVLAASVAFERLVRDRLGDNSAQGVRATLALFDRAAKSGDVDARRLEGLRAIAGGAMSAYRNQAAHGRMEFPVDRAREIVSIFSLLSHEVDQLPAGPKKAQSA
jgi:hypothetical protein